jgi:prefoldin subunit 5
METLDLLKDEKRAINNNINSVKADISNLESESTKIEREFPNFEIQQRRLKKIIERSKIDLEALLEKRILEEDKIRMFHEEKEYIGKKLDRLYAELRDVEEREARMKRAEQRERQY